MDMDESQYCNCYVCSETILLKMFVGYALVVFLNPQQLPRILEAFQLIFLYLHFHSEQICLLHH
jgi:hypothetical protein